MIPDQFKQIASRLLGLEQNVSRLMAQQIPYSRYGSAFPTDNLFDGRQFFRTDRRIDYSYDLTNTRWVSDIITMPLIPRDTSPFTQAAHTLNGLFSRYDLNGFIVENLQWAFFPNGTAQSGVNFYTLTNACLGTGNTTPTLAGTTDTKTMTTNAWNPITNTFSANANQLNTVFGYVFNLTPTGAPGTFFLMVTLEFRLIG